MMQITIRKRALASGKSFNEVIQEMLREQLGEGQVKPSESLRALAGGWSREEAAEFTESIQPCEQVDQDMWK